MANISQSLPPNVLSLIKEYSKPQTRTDWKTNPKIDFTQFYNGVRRRIEKKKVLYELHVKIQNDYNNYYVYSVYMKYLQYDGKRIALEKIERELKLEPKIVLLMNEYFLNYY
jgi:hypothetical protein